MLKKFFLRELADYTGAKLIGNPDHEIFGVDSLETATSKEASFLSVPRYQERAYQERMKNSHAGVICVQQETDLPEGHNFLISKNPSLTFQKIVDIFLKNPGRESAFLSIHPTAVIHESSHIDKEAQIGPYVVIDRGVQIGNGVKIFSHVSIGPDVAIGKDCRIHSHVIIREGCILGERVIIQPGAVIGSCGFGYSISPEGHHIKLDQLGIVVIEDDVEIGANTTIDRARFKETRIGKGTKIDNLVQIGHNVILGADNLIVAQTGISGSVKTGHHVVMGGQAGIVGHLQIADGTMIASRGGVSKTIDKTGKYAGAPVMPLAEHNKQQVYVRKIATYIKKIEELESRLKKLES